MAPSSNITGRFCGLPGAGPLPYPKAVAGLVAVAVLLLAASAAARVTPFSEDVATAIDRGLSWLDGRGAFGADSSAGNAAGLVALALLEKRESADQDAARIGHEGAQPADQQRIDRIIGYIIGRANGAGFYAYRDGADLMALSVYLRTGGPNQNGALGAIRTVFDRIAGNQNGSGYWCYNNGGCNDSSTTQLSMAGLASARAVFNDPAYADANRLNRLDQLTARCRQGYASNGQGNNEERGHGYQTGRAASMQQTSSGLWAQIIGGGDVNDVNVQRYLRWLYNRYNYV